MTPAPGTTIAAVVGVVGGGVEGVVDAVDGTVAGADPGAVDGCVAPVVCAGFGAVVANGSGRVARIR